MVEEHMGVGNKKNNCEFCEKGFPDEKEEELVSDVEGCEIYAHKKCFERARMLIEQFEDSYEDCSK